MKRYKTCSLLSLSLALISVVATTAVSLFLASAFSRVQPEPYMDEVFHVRQTTFYLQGNWTEWDNKITTPPGTYLLFWTVHRLLQRVNLRSFSHDLFCFRSFNSFISGINHLLLWCISLKLGGGQSSVLTALSIITNPVLFFFSALYYTDQCALLFTLLMIYTSLTGCIVVSALCGAYGVLVRQTNIVWLLPSLCILVGQRLASVYAPNQANCVQPSRTWFRYVLSKTTGQPQLVWRALCQTVLGAPIHLLVVLGFVFFIFWNGGIVLGDRSAHKAVFHVCQLWYFAVFCTVLTPCEVFRFVFRIVLRWKRSNYMEQLRILILSLCALSLIVVSLRYTSFVHPYLLADNRHYTFYAWRKIIARSSTMFYALSVVYLVCTAYWIDCLFGSGLTFSHWLVNISIILGTVVSLVPAGLLEPRYFLLPYTLWRLFASRFRTGRTGSWFLELVMNTCVIGLTSYLFYAKPFFWAHEPGIQRFMW